VDEVCRFGSEVFIKFQVENRSRSLLAIGDLEVTRRLGNTSASLEVQKPFLTARELDFDKTATGVVGVDSEDGSGTYELRLTEQGGNGREVVARSLSL
jgi:hypothetical protein